MLIEGPDAHCSHLFRDEVADRVVDHGGCNTGLQSETVRQIGGDVEFTAAHVNLALLGFAEWNDSGIQSMDQGTHGKKVEGALRANL